MQGLLVSPLMVRMAIDNLDNIKIALNNRSALLQLE